MKLLYCENCQDVFKLRLDEMRCCACGKVRGRYVTNSLAQVSPSAISIAIGNGSLFYAIGDMRTHQLNTNDQASRHEYYAEGQGKIGYAWVRPNSGLGNPHTELLPEATDDGVVTSGSANTKPESKASSEIKRKYRGKHEA